MASLSQQKELQAKCRKELYTNVYLLNIKFPFGKELSYMVTDDLFEKPNQALFIHLSHYLANIIDGKRASMLTWPLIDKKTENIYRTQLVNFCSIYFKDGTIAPILASHLVNASGYKVIKLMFQLSIVALKSVLQKRYKNDEILKKIEMFEHIKDSTIDLSTLNDEVIEAQRQAKLKLLQHMTTMKKYKQISEAYKRHIIKLESECKEKQAILNKIVDSFEILSNEITEMKDPTKPSQFLIDWYDSVDDKLSEVIKNWDEKVYPLSDKFNHCKTLAESLMLRNSLKVTSQIEFDSDANPINFTYLEKHVTGHQKYVIKNVVKDKTLSIPYLIRAYIIALGHIFKGVNLDEDVQGYFTTLDENVEHYETTRAGMKELVEQLHSFNCVLKTNIERKDESYNLSRTTIDTFNEIPPIPRIKFNTKIPLFHSKTYTPINVNRLHFNLGKCRQNLSLPTSKPIHEAPPTIVRDRAFLKNLASFKVNLEQTKFVLPSVPQAKLNQTSIDRSSAFSRQQLNRLLSSQKTSSKKNSTFKERTVNHHLKPNRLFDETIESDSPLYKCHSSPNLNQSNILGKLKKSQFSEITPDKSELSGFRAINSNTTTPESTFDAKLENTQSMPMIVVDECEKATEIIDLCSIEKDEVPCILETPKYERKAINKTSSIEKLLERYRFRKQSPNKENNVNRLNVKNGSPLPDLISGNSGSTSDDDCRVPVPSWSPLESKVKGRESLGQVLGVDQSFLDQFDLID